MAKLNLSNLADLRNPVTAAETINSNNNAIEFALENTLSLDGTSPNSMEADLDMDSNRILNLPAPVGETEPVRYADLLASSNLSIPIASEAEALAGTANDKTMTPLRTQQAIDQAIEAFDGDVGEVELTDIEDIATNSLLGRDTAGTGSVEVLSLDDSLEFTGSGSIQRAAISGDITIVAGSNTAAITSGVIVTADISDNQINNAKLANMATNTIKGRTTAATGDPEDLTAIEVRELINQPSSNDRNMVFNPGFEDSFSGWTASAGVAIATDSSGISGAQYVAMDANTTLLSDPFMPVEEGSIVEVACYVKGSSADATHARITYFFYDEAHGTSTTTNIDGAMTTSWVRLASQVTVPANKRFMRIRIAHVTGSAATTMYVDQPSVVRTLVAATMISGTVPVANGGTNLASYAVGDVLYASGATTLSKLADVATGNVILSGGVTTAPAYGKVGLTTHVSGTLPVANGGTDVTSYAVGDLLYASGATTLSKLADIATGNALISGGVTTAPSYGKIGLTTHVSGTLPIANGGTNAITERAAAASLKVPYVLAQSFASGIQHTGNTNETTLATITVPAGAMGTTGALDIEVLWEITDNANNKTIRTKFGGTSFVDFALTNQNSYLVRTLIGNRGSASVQVGTGTNSSGFGSGANSDCTDATINTAVAQDITITVQLADAGDTAILQGYKVLLSVP